MKEREVLQMCRAWVAEGRALRELDLSDEARKIIRGFQLYTLKPLLIVVNVDEAAVPEAQGIYDRATEGVSGPGVGGLALSARIESDLAELGSDDAAAFMEDLQITDLAIGRLIRLSYSVMGLTSFLTAADPEARAWPIPAHTSAVAAADLVHSDMARGFIRAEVVAFSDLDREGTYARCREKGLVRLEGKQYLVQDGDVILFRFNV